MRGFPKGALSRLPARSSVERSPPATSARRGSGDPTGKSPTGPFPALPALFPQERKVVGLCPTPHKLFVKSLTKNFSFPSTATGWVNPPLKSRRTKCRGIFQPRGGSRRPIALRARAAVSPALLFFAAAPLFKVARRRLALRKLFEKSLTKNFYFCSTAVIKPEDRSSGFGWLVCQAKM